MKDILLSIIVAAYNVEDYLEKTLNSLNINRPEEQCFEVIIINDGSNDNTGDVAMKYVNAHPEVFKYISKENGGHGSVINVGIKRSNGKYIKILDGDDWFDDDGFRLLLEKLSVIDADLLITDQIIDNQSTNISKEVKFDDKNLAEKMFNWSEYVVSNQLLLLPNITIKRERVDNSNLQISENILYDDLEWVCKCISLSRTLYYYPITLYHYRVGREGQSVSLSKRRENIQVLIKMTKYIEDTAKIETVSNKKAILFNLSESCAYGVFLVLLTLSNYSGKKQTREFVRELDKTTIKSLLLSRPLFAVYYFFGFTYTLIAKYYRWSKQIND